MAKVCGKPDIEHMVYVCYWTTLYHLLVFAKLSAMVFSKKKKKKNLQILFVYLCQGFPPFNAPLVVRELPLGGARDKNVMEVWGVFLSRIFFSTQKEHFVNI